MRRVQLKRPREDGKVAHFRHTRIIIKERKESSAISILPVGSRRGSGGVADIAAAAAQLGSSRNKPGWKGGPETADSVGAAVPHSSLSLHGGANNRLRSTPSRQD